MQKSGSNLHDGDGRDTCLSTLNLDRINWSRDSHNCSDCDKVRLTDVAEGSYASSLRHYEELFHAHLSDKNRIRLLILFLDPRPTSRFSVCRPDEMPKGSEHRYFSLTPTAWKSLGLNKLGPEPTWPCCKTAPYYLLRYYYASYWGLKPWSYDAFIAYLLYLLRPEFAYITNLAKCYFENDKKPQGKKFSVCAQKHLRKEIECGRFNVVISLSRDVQNISQLERRCKLDVDTPKPNTLISLYHPAARVSAESKRQRFLEALEPKSEAAQVLASLGGDVVAIKKAWKEDSCRAETLL